MSWKYVVVKRKYKGEIEYGIHEHYGESYGYTIDPVPVVGESLEELKMILIRMVNDIGGENPEVIDNVD